MSLDKIVGAIEKIALSFVTPQVIVSFLVIVIALIIIITSNKATRRYIRHQQAKDSQANVIKIARRVNMVIRYALIILAFMLVLQINGIDISALAAGLGVGAIIAGFALQDLLSDLAMGIRIVTDSYFKVGDIIKVGTFEGEVLSLTPQSTKLRSIMDETVMTISNRNLTTVIVEAKLTDLDIPLDYEAPLADVDRVMNEAARQIAQLEGVERAAFIGTQNFEGSDIAYRLRFWVDPRLRPATLRAARRIVQDLLEANGMTIPYPIVDLRPSK